MDGSRRMMLAGAAGALIASATPAPAQQAAACYVGRDYTGGEARLEVVAERYGDFFEIYGTLRSAAVGTMRLKADGWSGAGRLFRAHEYESGALYIRISQYTGQSFVLEVEGYGSYPFQQTAC